MTKDLPVLIVDKKGIIGSLLAQKISDKTLVVLVSKTVPQENSNIVHIPFSGSVPQIPDNTYSRILIVDDKSKITKDTLDSYLKKAKEDSAYIYFATFLGQSLKDLNLRINTYDNAKIVLIGEVFDDEYIVEENIPISFINQIKQEGKIDIRGDGTDVSFPVSLEDVINSLAKIIFENIKEPLICIFPKNPITHLSLAHLFQKQNPLIKIDFKKGLQKNNFSSPLDGYFYAREDFNLAEKIKNLKLNAVRNISKTETTRKPYLFSKAFLGIILSLIFIIALPLICTYFFSFLGGRELLGVKENFLKGDFKNAEKSAQTANAFLKVAKYSSGVLSAEADVFGQRIKVEELINQTESLYLISEAGVYLADSADKFNSTFKNPSYSKQEFLDGANALKSSVSKLRELEAINGLPPTIKRQFSEYSLIIDLLDNSIDHLPKALGLEGEKKYLFLFLNNMELRPGGGFIGSYGVARVKNAKLTDFKIYDVYDADGQLKEHLEPPFPVRRYLPSAHFYLRDSNFYLNFSDNALSAQNFLFIEKKEKFDGVIAVDVSFTKYILEVLGGVNLPSYNENVTSENFFTLADRYSRDEFFPGSTQKKDFLGAVFRAIQNETATKKISYLAFAQAVAKGILEKHIQLYFSDPAMQNSAVVSGMSPGVFDSRANKENFINDYSGVIEANLGVNKVNKDVARTISKSVEIKSDGKVISTINVSYKNNSKKDNYKNYIRFVVPLGSNLEEVKLNGKSQDIASAVSDPGIYETKNFKPPLGLEVLKDNQSGKTVFGFLLAVPKDNIKMISLTYSLQKKIDADSSLSYSLRYIKQPGTEDYPFGFKLVVPDSIRVIGASEKLLVQDGKLSYETQLEKDLGLEIKLSPK